MPGMVVRGYSQKIAAEAVVSRSKPRRNHPPSLLAIIVGSIADVSIAKLLIAGVVPGLMLGGIFLAYVFIRIALNPDLAPGNVASEREVTTIRELVFALVKTLPFALVIFSVMGLISFGDRDPIRVCSNRRCGRIGDRGDLSELVC